MCLLGTVDVRMDDDSCVMDSVEIVPAEDYRNGSVSSDSPCPVKVCMLFIFCA